MAGGARVHDLTLLLEEAQQILGAIRSGDVDALVVSRDGEAPRMFLRNGDSNEESAHRALLETLNEGAMTIAQDGTVLYANRRLAELLDRPLAKVLGASLAGFVAPECAVALAELVSGAIDGGKRESCLLRPDGQRVPVMMSMRAIDSQPRTYTVVATDLTALKAAEMALRRAKDELEARVEARTAELERLNAALRLEIAERTRLTDELRQKAQELVVADRAKDEFLSMLAHELRNPLSPILTATEMLRRIAGPSPAIERHRAVIERQAKNLAHIVDDLLDVSRITRRKIALRRRPLDLRDVVESAVDATRPLIDAAQHELLVSLPLDPVTLLGDSTRLEQVLVNLLNNAAKYTRRGGRIALSVEIAEGDAVVRVRDSGIGIPPELLPQIFDLFVQGKRSLARSQGGLGIGLTLVKNLVEMHGGTVEAHSDGAGQGTEITVYLPLEPREIEAPDSYIPEGDTGPGFRPLTPPVISAAPKPVVHESPQRRVLVVEDNIDVAEGLVDLLEVMGYRVEAAHNGEAALRLAEELRPHAAIVDIGLPGIDGFEVARRLRSHREIGGRMLLIGATGYGQERDRRRGAEAGFDHYLVKPMSTARLQQLLETHCQAQADR